MCVSAVPVGPEGACVFAESPPDSHGALDRARIVQTDTACLFVTFMLCPLGLVRHRVGTQKSVIEQMHKWLFIF